MPYLIFALVVGFAFCWFKNGRIPTDTITAFTGGLGSGKSLISVKTALSQLRSARVRTALYNAFHPRARLDKPMLYSNIPIRVSRREFSLPLTSNILTLQESIVKGSVCLLDEVDNFANQFEWENPNICKVVQKDRKTQQVSVTVGGFDDFCRYFRHYYASAACEPRLILNTQAVSNITLSIRRRMNTVYTLRHLRRYRIPFLPFFVCSITKYDLSDESIVNQYDESKERPFFGFFPRRRLYDTHCYSDRAQAIPCADDAPFTRYKLNAVTRCPYTPLPNLQKESD